MAQEDKELLLKDLSSRLPYGVKCHCDYNIFTLAGISKHILVDGTYYWDCYDRGAEDYQLELCKPYLRPMASMTKEEKEIYYRTFDPTTEEPYYRAKASSFDWLNAHHFDYRGLIEKGLALEAPEGMYN